MNSNIRCLVVSVLFVLAWAYMQTHHDRLTLLSNPLGEFPDRLGQWRMTRNSEFDQRTLDVLKPTDYLAKRFTRPDGAVADLYVGYHDGASQAGPLHSPKNCLPGSGWYEVSSERISVQMPDGNMDAVVAVYQNDTSFELFLYWFVAGGKFVADEFSLKIQEVVNSIRYGRRDASFVRISVPIVLGTEQANKQALDFLNELYPVIIRFLPS